MSNHTPSNGYDFDRESGLRGHCKDNKFVIPSHITDIHIDVGLAGDAPNSALWLLNPDCFTIGIEPVDHHLEGLFNCTTRSAHVHAWPIVQLYNNSVTYKGEKMIDIAGRFCLVRAAIFNTQTPKPVTFYLNKQSKNESGSSSVVHPSQRPLQFQGREDIFDKEIKVPSCSLEYILKHIDASKYPYITHLKTDLEGYDFEGVMSAGSKITNIVFITCEWNHNTTESQRRSFHKFMTATGFSVLRCEGGNIDFGNNRYKELARSRGLICRTHGF